MLYLIGGTARVGKTTLASRILERKSISTISTDVWRNVLDSTPPGLGLEGKTREQQLGLFFPYFFRMLKCLNNKYPDYVVEGDLFTPEQIVSLGNEIDLKCVFLGSSHITLGDLKKIESNLDWVSKLPPEKQETIPQELMKRSTFFKTEAEKYNFPYFDIYPDREKALDDAYNILFS